jgi:hypothetical protein
MQKFGGKSKDARGKMKAAQGIHIRKEDSSLYAIRSFYNFQFFQTIHQ